MVLMHTAALGTLRKELILSVGKEHARRILTRMGYAAACAMPSWPNAYRGHQSMQDAFSTGPQLHMLEGIVHVSPVRMI